MLGVTVNAARDPFSLGSHVAAGLNAFAYWTIDANLLSMLAGIAVLSDRWARSKLGAALLLTALVAISQTCIVFNLVLRDGHQTGLQAIHAELAHVIVPVLVVGGWVAFVPRGTLRAGSAIWPVLFATFWIAATLARGGVIGKFPYKFLDFSQIGIERVAGHVAVLAAVTIALSAMFVLIDSRLAQQTPETNQRDAGVDC